MATELDKESGPRELVEHLRSTGYEGRESWISALDPALGVRVVAARQMEACATQPACAWRDDIDDEPGLWRFMRDCLLASLESFAQVIEATVAPSSLGSFGKNSASQTFKDAWKTVSDMLAHLRTADPAKTSYATTAVSFLLAVMALRQIVDAEARGTVAGQSYFAPFSTNVHPTFLPNLFEKLGSSIIDVSAPVRLAELSSKLEVWSRPSVIS